MNFIKKNIFFIAMILFASGMLLNDKTDIFRSDRYKEPTVFIYYSKNEIEDIKSKIYTNTLNKGCEIFNLKIFEKEDGTIFTQYKFSRVNLRCKEVIKEEINKALRNK